MRRGEEGRGSEGAELPGGGVSLLHSSSARKLHSSPRLASILHSPPPSHTSLPRLPTSHLHTSVAAGSEPLLFSGATEGWRAGDRWGSVASLLRFYGELRVELSPGVHCSLRDFLDYAERNTADFPLYVAERELTQQVKAEDEVVLGRVGSGWGGWAAIVWRVASIWVDDADFVRCRVEESLISFC